MAPFPNITFAVNVANSQFGLLPNFERVDYKMNSQLENSDVSIGVVNSRVIDK